MADDLMERARQTFEVRKCRGMYYWAARFWVEDGTSVFETEEEAWQDCLQANKTLLEVE